MDGFVVSYLILWFVVIVLFAAVFVLYRHLGQQLLVGRDQRMAQGPEIGSRLRHLDLRDLHGARVELEQPARERGVLLFVATTSCAPCRGAMPALAEFASMYRDSVESVLVCRGTSRAEVAEFTAELGPDVRIVPDPQWLVGSRLKIATTPFALITDAALIVRGKGAPDKREAFEWFREQIADTSVRDEDQLIDLPASIRTSTPSD